MSINELNSKVQELRELRRMADELAGEIEQLQDSIKAEMTARGTDEAQGVDWKITWKAVTAARFDSKAFKADHADLFRQYSKSSTSRRFVIA